MSKLKFGQVDFDPTRANIRSTNAATKPKVSYSVAAHHEFPLEIMNHPQITGGGGLVVDTADAQKLLGGVDSSGNLRVLDNILDAKREPILVPGLGIDMDAFCSWLPTKNIPGVRLASHRGSHPGFTGAVAEKLGEIGRERARQIRLSVGATADPGKIAEAIVQANRAAEDAILALQAKIRKALSKPTTLHRDSGHLTSSDVFDAWILELK